MHPTDSPPDFLWRFLPRNHPCPVELSFPNPLGSPGLHSWAPTGPRLLRVRSGFPGKSLSWDPGPQKGVSLKFSFPMCPRGRRLVPESGGTEALAGVATPDSTQVLPTQSSASVAWRAQKLVGAELAGAPGKRQVGGVLEGGAWRTLWQGGGARGSIRPRSACLCSLIPPGTAPGTGASS